MRIKHSFQAALILCAFAGSTRSFAFITVYGGPAYDQTIQTGYYYPKFNTSPGAPVSTNVGVLSATKYASGEALGTVAIRWDASSATATELGTLSTSSSGSMDSTSVAVNATGTAVGYARRYSGTTNLGDRAVRWNASGTAVTELDNLGTDSSGKAVSQAWAINAADTAVSYSEKYSGTTYLGERAVRWNASGTAATELGNLGTNNSGNTASAAFALNPAGTAVGAANKYTGDASIGYRAVRWDASGTAATELGNLGTDSTGNTYAVAFAMNPAGTAVGYANKYSGDTTIGKRAVRWNASGTAATELGNLGTNTSGLTNSEARAVNAGGTAVGYADKYAGNTFLGQRAVLWNYNALAIDLNTLIDPNSGWTLFQAYGISDTNITIGLGSFDPDGAGPLGAYGRAFLLDVSSAVSAPGDFNNDHKVDAADYVIWRKTNGTQVGYDAWRTNFGSASGSGAGIISSQTAVPEPSTFVSAALSLAAALLVLGRGRV